MRLRVEHGFRKRGCGFRAIGPISERDGSCLVFFHFASNAVPRHTPQRGPYHANCFMRSSVSKPSGCCLLPQSAHPWAASQVQFPWKVMTICVGQSTGAHCDFSASAMPLEPRQEGCADRLTPEFNPPSERSAPTKGRARIRVASAARSIQPILISGVGKETPATLRFLQKRGLGTRSDQAVPSSGTRTTPMRKPTLARAGRARLCRNHRGKPGVSHSQSKAGPSRACSR
jgi:hypothetical protein